MEGSSNRQHDEFATPPATGSPLPTASPPGRYASPGVGAVLAAAKAEVEIYEAASPARRPASDGAAYGRASRIPRLLARDSPPRDLPRRRLRERPRSAGRTRSSYDGGTYAGHETAAAYPGVDGGRFGFRPAARRSLDGFPSPHGRGTIGVRRGADDGDGVRARSLRQEGEEAEFAARRRAMHRRRETFPATRRHRRGDHAAHTVADVPEEAAERLRALAGGQRRDHNGSVADVAPPAARRTRRHFRRRSRSRTPSPDPGLGYHDSVHDHDRSPGTRSVGSLSPLAPSNRAVSGSVVEADVSRGDFTPPQRRRSRSDIVHGSGGGASAKRGGIAIGSEPRRSSVRRSSERRLSAEYSADGDWDAAEASASPADTPHDGAPGSASIVRAPQLDSPPLASSRVLGQGLSPPVDGSPHTLSSDSSSTRPPRAPARDPTDAGGDANPIVAVRHSPAVSPEKPSGVAGRGTATAAAAAAPASNPFAASGAANRRRHAPAPAGPAAGVFKFGLWSKMARAAPSAQHRRGAAAGAQQDVKATAPASRSPPAPATAFKNPFSKPATSEREPVSAVDHEHGGERRAGGRGRGAPQRPSSRAPDVAAAARGLLLEGGETAGRAATEAQDAVAVGPTAGLVAAASRAPPPRGVVGRGGALSPPSARGAGGSGIPGGNGSPGDDSRSRESGDGKAADAAPQKLVWQKGEPLGSGTFGTVYTALDQSTGALFAVKCVKGDNAKDARELQAEIRVMRRLQHPHIVRYLGAEREAGGINIFMELVPGGSVAALLKTYGPLREPVVQRYTRQILLGVAYLHKRSVVHRDIKGGNVLVSDKGVAKLADFGCATKLQGMITTSLDDSLRKIRGSVPWMAPEVIRQTGGGRLADIWSIGATVIEMATAGRPWPNLSNNLSALFHVATSGTAPPIPDTLSAEGSDFILRCCDPEPARRWSAEKLLSHPFVSERLCHCGCEGPAVADDLVAEVAALAGTFSLSMSVDSSRSSHIASSLRAEVSRRDGGGDAQATAAHAGTDPSGGGLGVADPLHARQSARMVLTGSGPLADAHGGAGKDGTATGDRQPRVTSAGPRPPASSRLPPSGQRGRSAGRTRPAPNVQARQGADAEAGEVEAPGGGQHLETADSGASRK